MVNRRILVRPKRGNYALAPAHLHHLSSLESTVGKERKSIDINSDSVDKVPDTITEGKEVLTEVKVVENVQTPLFSKGLH